MLYREQPFKPKSVLVDVVEVYQSPERCLKFHFWNLNGYSDLSAVEGIVGG